MPPIRSLSVALLAGLAASPLAYSQAPKDSKEDVLTRPTDDSRDLTLLRRVTERTFIHELARISYTIPAGWKEIRPHRLDRKIDPRISTVLGIERSERDLVASLYWTPISAGQKVSNWVRDTPDANGEYGEEYETLRVVYGKDKVTTPTKFKHGPFDVYRINISDGPDRGDRYDGTLLLFSVETGETTWLMRARISYPKKESGRNDQYALDVLEGYNQVPDKNGPGKNVEPEIPVIKAGFSEKR